MVNQRLNKFIPFLVWRVEHDKTKLENIVEPLRTKVKEAIEAKKETKREE